MNRKPNIGRDWREMSTAEVAGRAEQLGQRLEDELYGLIQRMQTQPNGVDQRVARTLVASLAMLRDADRNDLWDALVLQETGIAHLTPEHYRLKPEEPF